THESGGIVWTYMGPKETMTPFRDFGTESLPSDQVAAFKTYSPCNYVQAMEGNLDSAHISFLHQFNAIDDIPDDGTDTPGYNSNAMSMKIWRHDKAPRFEMEEYWYGYRYGALRTTPNGHTHVRINAFVMPFNTLVASIPFSTRQSMFVPIDDEHCWRYGLATQPRYNPDNLGGPPYAGLEQWPYSNTVRTRTNTGFRSGSAVVQRQWTAENDYQIDRSIQADRSSRGSFSGVAEFNSQDLMVTESMGPIYDRSKEHLGTTDVAIIRMRSMLINAARDLAAGKQPPAVSAEHDYKSIRVGEKILEPDEDWRAIGTDEDQVVKESFAAS
ncbi:MAG: hypothetical protein FWC87_16080, partial [Acidimicrobiaceae bacterium]|nr:hypothetical protein [Acidimicrobiaceae bacterium]